jgi:hypothetical protein
MDQKWLQEQDISYHQGLECIIIHWQVPEQVYWQFEKIKTGVQR